MLVDFFKKYFQGYIFVKFHYVIMGWKKIDTLQMGPSSTKENVGNVDKVESRTNAEEIYTGKKKSYVDIVISEITKVNSMSVMLRYDIRKNIAVTTYIK